MKAIAIIAITAVVLSTQLFAQAKPAPAPAKPAPVAAAQPAAAPTGPVHYVLLPTGSHDAIDMASTKLDNITLRYNAMAEQFEKVKAQMQSQYQEQLQVLNSQIAENRKSLGLPDSALFTGTQPVPATPTTPAKPAWSFEVSDAPVPAAPAKKK